LALVDEVSVDSVTRGALKDDSTFKGLRDVIKKGNRVLEEMLVRRERKYTLFFRLVQPHDRDQIERMKAWNQKVEKAVGAVTDNRDPSTGSENDSDSTFGGTSDGSSVSSRAGVFSRGRQLLPTAGRVRSRRATPTPRLRKHRGKGDDGDDAADDGFAAATQPSAFDRRSGGDDGEMGLPGISSNFKGGKNPLLAPIVQIQPKDELVDVIRGLRVEKIQNQLSNADEELAALKPNWLPKAEIPSSVPKLPTEYVHRHRLMKQVVSCLLDENEVQVSKDGQEQNTSITCVTSRHGDKAGNGKSTLAIAVIQTVEVRERFPDGIAWLKLGRGPLSERDIRRLYEDLYRQLVVKEADMDASSVDGDDDPDRFQDSYNSIGTDMEGSENQIDRQVDKADSVRRFQGGDLEGIKEDLGRMLIKQKVLICLDDVWRVEDAKWFIFETPSYKVPLRDSPCKILITTRTPGLLGNGSVPEVFVRILSEHEAVKLLLSTAGRRPYGGRNSEVFNQSRLIVKGCGNSPLGILLVGSMLRQSNRNWNLKSPVWQGCFNQCSMNLEEAAQLRSFRNAFTRIVDMCFFTIRDVFDRIALRRCFVLFAMAFRANDWVLSGKGIPQSILLRFFETVITTGPTPEGFDELALDPMQYVVVLENLKLLQRTRHTVSTLTTKSAKDEESASSNDDKSEKSDSEWDDLDELPKKKTQQFYTMHDSLKAAAELMAERHMPTFAPDLDDYTSFGKMIEEERKTAKKHKARWPSNVRFLHTPQRNGGDSKVITEEKVHELVSISIIAGGDGEALSKKTMSDAMKANHYSMAELDGGEKFEEYTMTFLTDHLRSSKALSSVSDLLTDAEFVRRRVFSLGIMEATGRQVADILDLRSIVGKAGPGGKRHFADDATSPRPGFDPDLQITFDMDGTVCEAARLIIDEVYKVTNSMGSSDSLGMATCLATVGEALLKSRQPRDAMLRLEEAVSIYRGLLGPYHVYTAHALQSVAKALVKLGETRVALLKFAEAARIYETCNATLHYDSIANAQSLASLLVDIGDIRKAESMFEEVISMKQTVYGDNSVPVAKTINSYAILLAKHGRMNDALRHYDIAKATYRHVPEPLFVDPEFDVKCNYDVTLITLNIASIYSKRGDLQNALSSYEEGVKGLNEYESSMEVLRERNGAATSVGSSHKHLVAALGRIGSLKLKLSDNNGALEAYEALIEQVDEDSPLASHVEQAKAHIKCATIYRGREDPAMHEKAIGHLKEALRMYKALYGPDHKDTAAIATSLKQWLAEDKS
jgi:tetratricopeptide (TPR) repeat protein